jgi:hypothetical protein
MWGALQLHAAITVGRAGRDGGAWAHWDRAERIDPVLIPSRERRGRLFVELARGQHAAGDRVAACRLLLRACGEGSDAVAWSPAARLIVDDLQARPPAAIRAEVADLAAQVGEPAG